MNSYKQLELNRYFLLYTFVLLASIQLWAKTATIRIQKQSQFDILHSMLDSMVLSYDCINVIFDSGKYYFNSDNGINISKNKLQYTIEEELYSVISFIKFKILITSISPDTFSRISLRISSILRLSNLCNASE